MNQTALRTPGTSWMGRMLALTLAIMLSVTAVPAAQAQQSSTGYEEQVQELSSAAAGNAVDGIISPMLPSMGSSAVDPAPVAAPASAGSVVSK